MLSRFLSSSTNMIIGTLNKYIKNSEEQSQHEVLTDATQKTVSILQNNKHTHDYDYSIPIALLTVAGQKDPTFNEFVLLLSVAMAAGIISNELFESRLCNAITALPNKVSELWQAASAAANEPIQDDSFDLRFTHRL